MMEGNLEAQVTSFFIHVRTHFSNHKYCEKERLGGGITHLKSDQPQAPIKLSSLAKNYTLISNCQLLTLATSLASKLVGMGTAKVSDE